MQAAGWYPAQVAGPALGKHTLVEIEGDGLEGQRPPRRRVEDVPDDPSEPYSPNYGAAPTLTPSPEPEPA